MTTHFVDELAAHRYLESVLWPGGPICPRCEKGGRAVKLDGNGAQKCDACGKIFSVTDRTIFNGSDVPLYKWLQAIYLTDAGALPIQPHHLAKVLNIPHTTAAEMIRRLEKAGLLVELLNSNLMESLHPGRQ